jgi:hypothetical protein
MLRLSKLNSTLLQQLSVLLVKITQFFLIRKSEHTIFDFLCLAICLYSFATLLWHKNKWKKFNALWCLLIVWTNLNTQVFYIQNSEYPFLPINLESFIISAIFISDWKLKIVALV